MNARSLTCSAIAMLVVTARPAAAQPYRVGDDVVVIADGNLTIGVDVVDNVWRGLVLTVEGVSGQWLWLSNGKPGWLDQRRVIPLNRDALDRLTAMIRSSPYDARLFSGRAAVHLSLGDPDAAIADYNSAIQFAPAAGAYFSNRGVAWRAKGNDNLAIADFNAALRLDARDVKAYNNRGAAWCAKGDYARAIADFNAALRIDPQYLSPYNNLAWLLAVCPVAEFRDGQRAVQLAIHTCQLTAWKNSTNLDTLAAAYAETGDFAKAIAMEERALDLAPDADKADLQSRLELYRQQQPYHEPAPRDSL